MATLLRKHDHQQDQSASLTPDLQPHTRDLTKYLSPLTNLPDSSSAYLENTHISLESLSRIITSEIIYMSPDW
jgi:hypothetical protein